jgi:membrane protein YqaA with SNARE-associated domain
MHFLNNIKDILVSYGPIGVLLLAFLDSAGIPVSAGMDAMIILVAVQTPDRAWLVALLAVIGSAAGNLLLFSAARKGRSWTRKEEAAVAPGEPGRFELWFREYGLITIFVPAIVPVIPLPLKVFVISAGVMRSRLSSVLSVILLARIIRYGGEAYLGIKLGQNSMTWLKEEVWVLTAAACAFCGVVFLVARWNRRRRLKYNP